MIIRSGAVHDAVAEIPYLADLYIKDGKILAIVKDGEDSDVRQLEEACGDQVIDAAGLQVYPGFVDAHCHLGLDDYGMRFEGADINENGDITAAHLRGIDSFYPQDKAIPKALAAGVTTVGTGPGSANVLGGTFFAVKTKGSCVDEMIVRNPVAMKCAFGENPKFCYRDKGNSTRMSTAAKLREMLFAAADYMKRKEAAGDDYLKAPRYDMKMEALIPVLKKEIPLKAHAHRADDICTALRIAKEFDINITLEHTTDGHLIVDQLVKAGVRCAVGPTLSSAGKVEVINKTFETPGILARGGVPVSIITDAPVIPQEYLPLCAGLAVKSGMDPFAALQAITINPARHLGIEDRVGSLEAGKDADVVLTDGDPLINSTRIIAVILNGKQEI